MAATDRGLIRIGSLIQGLTPTIPAYGVFGVSTNAFDGTKAHLGSEIPSLRKSLSWSFDGNDAVAQFSLLTTEANGSTITELGIAEASTSLGSDLWSRNLSAIGDKTTDFIVTVNVKWRMRRA